MIPVPLALLMILLSPMQGLAQTDEDSAVGTFDAGGIQGMSAEELSQSLSTGGDVRISFDGSASPGQIVTQEGAVAPTFVPGVYGQAIQFNGKAVVLVPIEINPKETPQITITGWVKRSNTSNIGYLVRMTGQGHPALRIYSGKLMMDGGRAKLSLKKSDPLITPDEWPFSPAFGITILAP